MPKKVRTLIITTITIMILPMITILIIIRRRKTAIKRFRVYEFVLMQNRVYRILNAY